MEAILTFELAPLYWGLIALLLIFAGAIVAELDPETTELYVGHPRWLMASIGVALVALVTIVATRPELSHQLRALFPN